MTLASSSRRWWRGVWWYGGVLLVAFSASSSLSSSAQLTDYIASEYSCYEWDQNTDTDNKESALQVRFATAMPTMQNKVSLVRVPTEEEEDTTDDNDTADTTTDTDTTAKSAILSQWSCGSHDIDCTPTAATATTTTTTSEEPLQQHRQQQQQRRRRRRLGEVTFAPLPPPGEYRIVLNSVGYHGTTMELESTTTVQVLPNGQECPTEDSVRILPQPQEPEHHHSSSLSSSSVAAAAATHYTTGQPIAVSFSLSTPQSGDAIALYPARKRVEVDDAKTDPQHDPQYQYQYPPPTKWLYTCGDRHCQEAVPHGTLQFGTHELPSGAYQAVLGRMEEPYDDDDGGRRKIGPPQFHPTTTAAPSTPFSFVQTVGAEAACPHVVLAPSQSCYVQGEDIPVNVDGRPGCRQASDKVAIFDASALLGVGGRVAAKPKVWLYTCGSQDCQEDENEEGDASSNDETDNDYNDNDDASPPEWPLSVGVYKIVLIRHHPGHPTTPYWYYESSHFRVVQDSCDDHETKTMTTTTTTTMTSKYLRTAAQQDRLKEDILFFSLSSASQSESLD